jgi:lipoprotein-releasing system permease protein
MKKKVRLLLFLVRNSLRLNKKQFRKPATLISFGGFALSVAILTAALTLLNGYQNTLKEGLLGVNAHVYLYGFESDKLSDQDIRELTVFLSTEPEVASFSPVMIAQVMALGKDQVKGVIARSIEWDKDELPINYHRYISRGSGELTGHSDAVIGSVLAHQLQIEPGDQITLITPVNMQYTMFGLKMGEVTVNVKGVFHSGIYDTDSRTIFLNEDLFPLLIDSDHLYDMIEVKLTEENVERADYLSYLWNMKLQNSYLIYSWIDFNSNLFTMLTLQKWVIAIILSFLVLIASFNIISNTTTTILEKKKEIGILKAVGCSNKLISYFFLSKTTLLSLLAIFCGIGCGFLLAYFLTKQTHLALKGDVYFIEQFSITPDIATIVLIMAISLLIALWAAMFAMKKITQLTIIETIRSG